MFSPLNDPELEHWYLRFQSERKVGEWFLRLNTPLKALSVAERAALNLEVRQHLESLVAAHEELGISSAEAWNLALSQFGNPKRIGRKMLHEWLQSRTGTDADKGAILYATTNVMNLVAAPLSVYFSLRDIWLISQGMTPLGYRYVPDAFCLSVVIGGILLAGVLIGRNRPYQAIKAAFYSSLNVSLLYAFTWGAPLILCIRLHLPHASSAEIVRSVLLTIASSLGYFAVAYLASVTKRGWYKPSLADFKLTLPRGRTRRLSPRG